MIEINSESDMLSFGANFAEKISSRNNEPCVLELIGDVGAGKTTFVRGLAKGLGVKDQITSPSFTISKVYVLPDNSSLIHYDFYRLGDPGLMVDDLTESLSDPKNIVVIEWADSVKNILPENRLTLKFSYTDSGSRLLEIINPGENRP